MRILQTFARSRLAVLLAIAAFVAFASPEAAIAIGLVPLLSGTTLAQIDQALQITYPEAMVNQVVQEAEWLDLITVDPKVKTDRIGAKYAELGIKLRGAGAAGGRLEDEYFQENVPAAFLNARVYLKKITFLIEMTGDTMRRALRDNESWVTYVDDAVTDAANRTRFHMDRVALLSSSGALARVQTAPSLVSTGIYDIAINRWGGVTGFTKPWLMFSEGDSIVFTAGITAPVTLKQGSATDKRAIVIDIDDAGNSDNGILRVEMTAALAAQVAVDDYIGEGDNRGMSFVGASTERDFMGLLGHVDDGGFVSTYFNVVRSSQRRFRGLEVDATTISGGRFDEELLEYCDRIAGQKVQAQPGAIVASVEGVASYWRHLKRDRMITDQRNPGGGKPGGLAVMLGDRTVPLRKARKLCPELSYLLSTEDFTFYGDESVEWDQSTGSMWNRFTDATGPKDRVYAVGFLYRQMVNTFPRRSVRIENGNQ